MKTFRNQAGAPFPWLVWIALIVDAMATDAPVLKIERAVAIEFEASPDQVYQPLRSEDNVAWTPWGEPISGRSGLVRVYHDAEADPGVFFQVEARPRPFDTVTVASIGMSLARVPAGAFLMGSPDDEADRRSNEGPQTAVTLSSEYFIGQTEVTQAQFEAVMEGANPSFSRGPDLPVESLTWDQAVAFCEQLTEQERAAGRLADEMEYRLPTEAEWERAYRAGTQTRFYWGDDSSQAAAHAWTEASSQGVAQPVAQLSPNGYGAFDMAGNVLEWTADWLAESLGGVSVVDPVGPDSGDTRVVRGGSYDLEPEFGRAATRTGIRPDSALPNVGFRVVLAGRAGAAGFSGEMFETEIWPGIALSLIRVPAGSFEMGSWSFEEGRSNDEDPRTNVTFTQDFYLGVTEVTQLQWEAIMRENPVASDPDPARPVYGISYDDAVAFCARLTDSEAAAGRLPSGFVYTLPTEAQWEYACRAGTITRYYFGDDTNGQGLGDHAWYAGNSGFKIQQAGLKIPNPWGLYDMHGNVSEWCLDYYAENYPGGAVVDHAVLSIVRTQNRVLRGGGYNSSAESCRSAKRFDQRATRTDSYQGMRVALAPTP